MSRKITTLWNFFFLNIRFVIAVVNGIFIIPLYLYFIDKSVYGAWLATGNILSWIAIVDPGVGDVLLQRVSYAYGNKDQNEISKIITSSIIISFILFLLAVLLGYSASFFISDLAKIPLARQAIIVSSFRIALWGTALILLTSTFTNICLAYQKTKELGIILNSIAIASIVITIILLNLKFGIYAIAYANLFRGLTTFGIIFFYSLFLIRKNGIIFKTTINFIRNFSKVFAFTFLSRIVETISSNIDLLLVSRFAGVEYVTILDISRRPITIVSGLVNNISISMLPTLPHLFGSKENEKINNVVSKFLFLLIWISAFIACSFLILNQALIKNWVGDNFWIGRWGNLFICIYFFLLMIGYALSNITYSMGDIKNNSLISITKSIVYLVLLFIMGKYFGINGILISAISIPLIMLAYFPYKIIKSNIISLNNLKILRIELVKVAVFILTALVIANNINIASTWWQLFYYAIAVATLFLLFLFFSKSVIIKEIKTLNLK